MAPITMLVPNTVKHGTATSTTSSGPTPSRSPPRTAVPTSARCDSRTPLGFPIVPDV